MKRFVLPVLFALAFAFPTFAQDATDEPAPPVVVTVEVTEAAPIETPAPTAPIPTDAIVLTGSQLLLYLGLAIFGGGGVMAIGYRFLELRQARDVTEKLYMGLAPEQQELIKTVVDGYEETTRRLLDFLKAVTDGLPNTEPPTPPAVG